MLLIISLKFLFCAVIIVISGYQLSGYSDIIAEKTGLSRTWIGVLLLASVTSLPELATGISSVTIAGAPDIALGNIMGSNLFNLLIIALLDFLHGPSPIFSKAHRGHIISAGFGIILVSMATISIFIYSSMDGGGLSIGNIGLYTPIIFLVYLLSMRAVYSFEKKQMLESTEETQEPLLYKEVSLRGVYIKFLIHSLVIVGTGIWLPIIGLQFAEVTGLGETFVGNIFIALSTSFPELVVCISAFKIGAIDLAIGNVLGSNLFNVGMLAIDDIFYIKAPLLAEVSLIHIIPGLATVIITGIVIVGLIYRSEKKVFMRISWDALSIVVIYILNAYLLYIFRM
ncbi:MAG: sodium:calcium antiporter [Thermodesulfobacteriota bacterium]